MVIVPAHAPISAEVTVDNRDIGFAHPGQVARIKREIFPFTRIGTMAATVQHATVDAVNDEQRGAVFPATLELSASTVHDGGRATSLSLGMNVATEIMTR